jgi:prepilin-type N-terminal cleavage/methylation domain-containing protein
MRKASTKGFTMIELVIGMLVFGILGTAVTMVFVNGLNFTRDEKSQTLHQLSLTDFNVRLEGDVRKSTGASIVSGCLVLAQAANVSYCYDAGTKKVSRNNVMLADEIETFTVSVNSNHIQITIATSPDFRDVTNTLELNYYIRQGNY